MYCIYHSYSLDSRVAAGIVLKYYRDKEESLDFISWNSNNKFPVLESDRRIILCGITFPINFMYYINELSKGTLVWINNNTEDIVRMLTNQEPAYCKSIIPKVNFINKSTPYYEVDKIGIGELTWHYLFPKQDIPKFIKLISSYETGRYKTEYNEYARYFYYAARAYMKTYHYCYTAFEEFEHEGIYDRWVNDGKIIQAYLDAVKNNT